MIALLPAIYASPPANHRRSSPRLHSARVIEEVRLSSIPSPLLFLIFNLFSFKLIYRYKRIEGKYVYEQIRQTVTVFVS